MAFVQKVGNLVNRSAGVSSSLCQAVRCMSSSKLFVGGISYGTDDKSLREAFANYGHVTEARVIMDRETGRSRGFGFVTYTSTEEAAAAITGMDGKDLQGRMVRVNYAHDRGSRTGGFGDGGRGGGYGGGYGSGGYAGDSYGRGGYSGGRGSYAGGGRYNDGDKVNSWYNTGGNNGVYEGGRGGYGSDTGYTGYNATPGNYSIGSFNQEGDAVGAYGGANSSTTNDNYVNNASNNASAGKLDDLLSDLKVDSAGEAAASGEDGVGFADDEIKDGQDDFLQDDIEDDETDDYASKRS